MLRTAIDFDFADASDGLASPVEAGGEKAVAGNVDPSRPERALQAPS